MTRQGTTMAREGTMMPGREKTSFLREGTMMKEGTMMNKSSANVKITLSGDIVEMEEEEKAAQEMMKQEVKEGRRHQNTLNALVADDT